MTTRAPVGTDTATRRLRSFRTAAGWIGAVAGAGLGLFFLGVAVWEVRHGAPGHVGFVIPAIVATVGAVGGAVSWRRVATRLGALDERWRRVPLGLVLGTVYGVVLLVPLAWLLYLLEQAFHGLHFRGGIAALLGEVLLYFGFIGTVLGASLGVLLGAASAVLLPGRAER